MAHYEVCKYGEVITEFDAKSDRAAKIHTSKFCGNSVDLYSLMGGIELYRDDVCIGLYSPFFFAWHEPMPRVTI